MTDKQADIDFKDRFDALASDAATAAKPYVSAFNQAMVDADKAVAALRELGLRTTIRDAVNPNTGGMVSNRLDVEIVRNVK